MRDSECEMGVVGQRLWDKSYRKETKETVETIETIVQRPSDKYLSKDTLAQRLWD